MLSHWFHFLKRPPRAGGGKDPIMSQATPNPPPDVSRQIADLTDAVNRLVQQQQQQQRPATENARGPSGDIGGDLPGGEPLVAAIDHAKLSPLQQITLGLRGATPVGLTHPAVLRADQARGAAGAGASEEAPPVGAD